MSAPFDILIIGGGINGTGIARDAAGRGLKVVLCERDDLAAHTSSASTKLIHGGLRYLEHLEFRLVREALAEREVLLRNAPHIVRPLRFVLPHHKGLRPAVLLRLGLFLYDYLGRRRTLPGSRKIDLRVPPHRDVLRFELTFGFEYADCWVDDARLVVLTALDAKERGATILTRTTVQSARRIDGLWAVRTTSRDGTEQTLVSRTVVNAGGPWVGQVFESLDTGHRRIVPRLVKGSHIVTRRLFGGEHAYIFQNTDKRVVFAIPYEDAFTLIGTTDVPFDADLGAVGVSQNEVSYLCNAVGDYMNVPIRPDDIVWRFAGVRPLFDDQRRDASTVTRDYVLDFDRGAGHDPLLLSVVGGKLTTHRVLAEQAVDKLAADLPRVGPAWTRHAPLPGGDLGGANFATYAKKAADRYPWLSSLGRQGLLRRHGSRLDRLLDGAHGVGGLGHDFGGGLYEAEVRYLIDHEWALTVEDILWRRTKCGLHMTPEQRDHFTEWIGRRAIARNGNQGTPFAPV